MRRDPSGVQYELTFPLTPARAAKRGYLRSHNGVIWVFTREADGIRISGQEVIAYAEIVGIDPWKILIQGMERIGNLSGGHEEIYRPVLWQLRPLREE